MDASDFAAKPDAYDALSAYQINQFFAICKLARDETDRFAANLLNCPVSATPVQGATSYTVSGDKDTDRIVQFRRSQLPIGRTELARKLYGHFVPQCESRGMFGPAHVYVANLVPGPAFCLVRNQLFSRDPTMEQRLEQMVQDFARFLASAWTNKSAHTLEPPPGSIVEYTKILNDASPELPPELQAKLEEVRQELPRLFQSSYPMVFQHDDLAVNNIHVDEASGRITGIVDWADAKVCPFGVSLANMEIVLGVQTRDKWHFHHNHRLLRELFWKTFYQETGHISDDDRRSIEVARLFGLFPTLVLYAAFSPRLARYQRHVRKAGEEDLNEGKINQAKLDKIESLERSYIKMLLLIQGNAYANNIAPCLTSSYSQSKQPSTIGWKQFSFLEITYLDIAEAATSIIFTFEFWYIKECFDIKTKHMFMVTNVFSVFNPFYNNDIMSDVTPRGYDNMFFGPFGITNRTSSTIGPNVIQVIIYSSNNNRCGVGIGLMSRNIDAPDGK
ncbi:hypothetical protein LZ554_006612 [Drepanopeziza brunnea f. sp. 'monogermtubi']|nr:hypothetical protein LZ554_006612 [Drepanopeziza brunnea f. sp. 'monogermtubi']